MSAGFNIPAALAPLVIDWGLIGTVLTLIILVLIIMWLMKRSGGGSSG